MKKLIAFILLTLPLFGLLFLNNNSFNLSKMEGITKACFITKKHVDIGEVVETASYNYVYVSPSQIEIARKKIEAEGIVVYFEGIDFNSLKNQLKMIVFSEEEIEGKKVICGFSPLLKKEIRLDNKKVNVQICIENESIIAGFPLILTGF